VLVEVLGRLLAEKTEFKEEEKPKEEAVAPGSEADENVFDSEAFVERMMGDEELAMQIIDGFIEDIPCQIAALKEALDREDAPLVRRYAHTIKGASSNVGANALRDAAFEVERASADAELNFVSAVFPRIGEQFSILKETLARTGFNETRGGGA